MKQILGILARLGIVAAVLVALVGGYALRAWIVPEKPQEPKRSVEKKKELWICSMNNTYHAYDSDDHERKCNFCDMQLIQADAAPAEARTAPLVMSERAKGLAGIQTSPVERRAVQVAVRLSGKIEYDETRLSTISAWVPGRIDRLYVSYTGTPVKKGEHLADFYSPELVTGQHELIQALRAVKEVTNSDIGIVRETAQATVVATRRKLQLLGLSDEQIAEVERTGKASDHVTITAPTGGIVTDTYVRLGQYVKTGTPLYAIADLSRVWVTLHAYESDLVWLGRGGQDVTFTTDAYPGETFRGRIAFVAPTVNKKTRSTDVRATIPNPDLRLKPEMLVEGLVKVDASAGGGAVNRALAGKWLCSMHPDIVADGPGQCSECGMALVDAEAAGYVTPEGEKRPLVIPASAPLLTGTRAVVYVEEPKAEKPTYGIRQVTLGPKAGDYYIVRSGLKEGERVVTEGNFMIDSDLQIKNRPSMMDLEAGKAAPPAKTEPKEQQRHRH